MRRNTEILARENDVAVVFRRQILLVGFSICCVKQLGFWKSNVNTNVLVTIDLQYGEKIEMGPGKAT